MKIFNHLGHIAKGICAFVFVGLGLTGCSENGEEYKNVYGPPPVEPPSQDEINCCRHAGGEGSPEFNNCIADYRNTGKCRIHTEEYTDAEKLCCGDDVNSTSFNVCINEYRATNECPTVLPPVYGPPPILEEDAEACCKMGYEEGTSEFADCVKEYMKTGICDIVMADYGPPPHYDEVLREADECCKVLGNNEDKAYKACVKDYLKTEVCTVAIEPSPDPDPPIAPPAEPSVDEKADECCKKVGDKDTDEYKACIEEYKKTGICAPVPRPSDPPAPSVYGPPPVEPPIDLPVEPKPPIEEK